MVETSDPDQIVNVIPVKPKSRGGKDVILLSLFHFMSGERHRILLIHFTLGNKFKKMAGDVQNPAGGIVMHGNGHSALAGDQADVANGSVAKIFWKVAKVCA